MEGVEGIPGTSLREAIQWDWESVAEYLDAVDRIPRAVDVAAQVPHGAARAFVMGERGAANEPASDTDIARMAEVVTEGVAAGAVGVSVNRLELHKAVDGREVPGTFAPTEEIVALVRAAAAGSPDAVFTTILPGAAGPDRDAWDREVDWLSRISRETGLAVTFPFGASGRRDWRDRLARLEREKRGRAHRPAGRLARAGPAVWAAHLARVPGSSHLRGAGRPARRATCRAHGRSRGAGRHRRRAAPAGRAPPA